MAEIEEKQLVFAAMCNTFSVIASKWHSSKICGKIPNSYLWRRTFQGIRGSNLLEYQVVMISSQPIGDKGGFECNELYGASLSSPQSNGELL